VQQLQTLDGWDPVRSYQAVFFAYALIGAVNFVLVFSLSPQIELPGDESQKASLGGEGEEEPLISDREVDIGNGVSEMREKRSLLPNISKESRAIIFKLCCLFAVDSLASGLVPA